MADLRALLGVKGQPVFTHTKTWPQAIPHTTSATANIVNC